MSLDAAEGLRFPLEAPAPGAAEPIADGLLWARLPVPGRLDHVNVYALDCGDDWLLIDSGLDWEGGRAALDALRRGPLGAKPVGTLLVTHHHPDHVGLAGVLAAEGVALRMPRTGWLTARMLTLDPQARPCPAQIAYRRAAGVTGAALEAYAAERPFNFADCVAPLPLGVTDLAAGETLEAAGRCWRVRLADGHAPDQALLAADGDPPILIAADHVLPGISPNIGVWPTEPEADPLGRYLTSLESLAAEARAETLVLPGHGLPFTGLPTRLRQLRENHRHTLDRILSALAEGPLTAIELFPTLYRRDIGAGEFGLALAEAVAHLNHLRAQGLAGFTLRADGARAWHPI